MSLQYIDDRLHLGALGWGKAAGVDLLHRGGVSCGSSKSRYGKNLYAMHGYCDLLEAICKEARRSWWVGGMLYTQAFQCDELPR